MVSLRDSLLSTSARSLPIRKRPDLYARRHHYLGRSYWIVKDPVGLNYYRFQEEEYAILNWLDGETSLDEIKERFEEEFPPQKITLDELQQFLGMLHRSGLVIASVGDQGKQLLKRRRERKWKEFVQAISNILCIRFKGFDPERFLNWLYPKVSWFYSRTVVTFCIMLGLAALSLVMVQFRTFSARLPAFHEFFSMSNALLLSCTLGLIKVLHEFGHGMTCKHFGGECHEMGVMVLVLTPCLYCNVSDSWMLPNKWHRAAIGAGGMYVELVLASIATFIWWYSEPGLLNHLCLNTMFVSSVSTVVFNANPLLRYDGYYILADVAEIPNLRQKATSILSRKMGEWCLGLEPPDDPFLPERNQVFFALYSVAAAIYRWVVVFSILFFLYKVFKPYRLEKLGQLMALASLWGLIVMPGWQLWKFFRVPGRLDKVKKVRIYATTAIVLTVLAGVAFIPLPHSVLATFLVQPRDADHVYVNVPEGGQLVEFNAEPARQVKKGDVLARLQSHDLEITVQRLEAKQKQLEVQILNMQQQGIDNPHASDELPQYQKELESVKNQLKDKRLDEERLVLRADRDGWVIPPPGVRKPHPNEVENQLPSWSGTPLDPENRGAYFRDRVLFCEIGNPKELEAMVIIDQSDIEFVHEGQKVDLKLDALPHDTLHGTLGEVAVSFMAVTPPSLGTKAGGELASKTDQANGIETPQSTSYQARVPINDKEGVLLPGLRGRAKIHTAPQSAGFRLWRLIADTFNFKL